MKNLETAISKNVYVNCNLVEQEGEKISNIRADRVAVLIFIVKRLSSTKPDNKFCKNKVDLYLNHLEKED